LAALARRPQAGGFFVAAAVTSRAGVRSACSSGAAEAVGESTLLVWHCTASGVVGAESSAVSESRSSSSVAVASKRIPSSDSETTRWPSAAHMVEPSSSRLCSLRGGVSPDIHCTLLSSVVADAPPSVRLLSSVGAAAPEVVEEFVCESLKWTAPTTRRRERERERESTKQEVHIGDATTMRIE
jgi:hypothetical protein